MLSYKRPRTTVQQLLLKQDVPFCTSSNVHVQNVLNRLKICRTASLGYHVYRCSDEQCGHIKYQYHSCRDRHCPNCGAIKKQEWIEARTQELLPVKYYHVVFTLPHELNSLVMGHRKILFKLLFDASAQTLLSFATDDNAWKNATKNDWRFLFPAKAMSIVYRTKFLLALKQMINKGEVILPDNKDAKQLLNLVYHKDWVVHAKAPFGGPHAVVEYLGRYTHKVAISNHRIRNINED